MTRGLINWSEYSSTAILCVCEQRMLLTAQPPVCMRRLVWALASISDFGIYHISDVIHAKSYILAYGVCMYACFRASVRALRRRTYACPSVSRYLITTIVQIVDFNQWKPSFQLKMASVVDFLRLWFGGKPFISSFGEIWRYFLN